MAVFIGTFENKVDRKGRVSVPATFRQALASQEFQGIVAFPSRSTPSLEGCGMDFMEEQVLSRVEVDLTDVQPASPPAKIFFELEQLSFDGEGRVILPQSLRDKAGITEQATFVGIGQLFQIWAPDRLATFRNGQVGGT